LNICGGKEIFTGPPDEMFDPIFQCCSREEADYIPEIKGERLQLHRGVYIPNVSIESYFKIGEELRFTDFVSEMLEDVGVNEFNSLIYASFILYHEEGHSVDFATSGLSPSEFINRHLTGKRRVGLHLQHILTLPEEERRNQLLFWQMTYNLMKAEQYANEYAVDKISTNLKKIQDFAVS
jgi:hypothetical protein